VGGQFGGAVGDIVDGGVVGYGVVGGAVGGMLAGLCDGDALAYASVGRWDS